MMKLLKAILCFIIFLPFCGWKVEEQTIHKVSNTLHTVNSPDILVNDITIHDDFVSIEFLYTVSTVRPLRRPGGKVRGHSRTDYQNRERIC